MAYHTHGWTPGRILKRATAQAGEDAEPVERRRFPRVKMELPGRYMTPDGAEYDCVTVDFSPGGVRFQAATLPGLGANIVAYVRDLGRLQGNVIRAMKDGFVIELAATALKVERLRHKIAWLRAEGVADRRLFPRLTLEGAMIPVRCADGRNQIAPIIDVSESGIAFRIGLALKIGDRVEIGEQTGIIVRLFEGGAAAKFT
jgi:hypothetical protein